MSRSNLFKLFGGSIETDVTSSPVTEMPGLTSTETMPQQPAIQPTMQPTLPVIQTEIINLAALEAKVDAATKTEEEAKKNKEKADAELSIALEKTMTEVDVMKQKVTSQLSDIQSKKEATHISSGQSVDWSKVKLYNVAVDADVKRYKSLTLGTAYGGLFASLSQQVDFKAMPAVSTLDMAHQVGKKICKYAVQNTKIQSSIDNTLQSKPIFGYVIFELCFTETPSSHSVGVVSKEDRSTLLNISGFDIISYVPGNDATGPSRYVVSASGLTKLKVDTIHLGKCVDGSEGLDADQVKNRIQKVKSEIINSDSDDRLDDETVELLVKLYKNGFVSLKSDKEALVDFAPVLPLSHSLPSLPVESIQLSHPLPVESIQASHTLQPLQPLSHAISVIESQPIIAQTVDEIIEQKGGSNDYTSKYRKYKNKYLKLKNRQN
jgi:hypothetical protein